MYRYIHCVLIILGGVSEHETLGNVECYDPETDRWVVDVIPQMRYRRSGVGVAVLQGLLFAIGGYLEGKTSTDAVECYNPRTKRYWWALKRMVMLLGYIVDGHLWLIC